MFYLLHKKKLLAIDPDRIYTFCPRCGTLHAVDLQAEIADGDCDLLGTSIYCDDCGAIVRAESMAATEKEECSMKRDATAIADHLGVLSASGKP